MPLFLAFFMLRLDDLRGYFASIPKDFTLLSDKTEFECNRGVLSALSKRIANLDESAASYELTVKVPNAVIESIVSFVHGLDSEFDDPFSCLLVAAELEIVSLKQKLYEPVAESLTEFNFEDRFSKISAFPEYSHPLVNFLASNTAFFASFSKCHTFNSGMTKVLLESAASLFSSEDSKLEFVLQQAESWSDTNFEAVRFIDCEKLSQASLASLCNHPKIGATNIRSHVKVFGLLRNALKLRSAREEEHQSLAAELEKMRNAHDSWLDSNVKLSQEHEDISCNLEYSLCVDREVQARLKALIDRLNAVQRLLRVVHQSDSEYRVVWKSVEELVKVGDSLAHELSQFYKQFLGGKLLWPGSSKAALNGSTEFKRIIKEMETELQPRLFEERAKANQCAALDQLMHTFESLVTTTPIPKTNRTRPPV